ncbi:ATP-binding cassette domain-containing protein [Streptomyces termitum]|uniref:ABC transporter domain-containing protein n=1 Tax=Streptomyces termitum TaxID=67368 RepID=A0A918W9J7_9ACTN|nr:ABC transporter ATP-binding protein [Streptomyces termitum]GHA85375.1 hypothetical protein GCM10010305_31440 [Streptomyces termitum]
MASDPRRTVTVRGLTRSFGDRTVLDGLDLTLEPGRFTALLGPPGCGRSTLLRILAGLDPEIGGTVLVPRRRAAVLSPTRPGRWRRGGLRRAPVQDPDLVLLDAPAAAPDRAEARRRGRTVLMAARDVDEALSHADRVVVLRGGVIAYDAPVVPGGGPALARLRARLHAELGLPAPVSAPATAPVLVAAFASSAGPRMARPLGKDD